MRSTKDLLPPFPCWIGIEYNNNSMALRGMHSSSTTYFIHAFILQAFSGFMVYFVKQKQQTNKQKTKQNNNSNNNKQKQTNKTKNKNKIQNNNNKKQEEEEETPF